MKNRLVCGRLNVPLFSLVQINPLTEDNSEMVLFFLAKKQNLGTLAKLLQMELKGLVVP